MSVSHRRCMEPGSRSLPLLCLGPTCRLLYLVASCGVFTAQLPIIINYVNYNMYTLNSHLLYLIVYSHALILITTRCLWPACMRFTPQEYSFSPAIVGERFEETGPITSSPPFHAPTVFQPEFVIAPFDFGIACPESPLPAKFLVMP